MPSPSRPARSRTRGARTTIGPMPVTISRSGRWPWRTKRRRPSSVSLSAWFPRNAATSASMAWARRERAPLRSTSVSGSENVPGWESLKTLLSVTAYRSFGGEVEARTPPRYAAFTPSRRHQLPPIAHGRRRRISKREVIAKHLVNKAASGDLKAIPLLLNEARAHQNNLADAGSDQVLDTPEDRKVLDGIIARIRSSSPESVAAPPTAEEHEPERLQRSHEIEE